MVALPTTGTLFEIPDALLLIRQGPRPPPLLALCLLAAAAGAAGVPEALAALPAADLAQLCHVLALVRPGGRALVLLEDQHEASDSLIKVLDRMVETKQAAYSDNRLINPRQKGTKQELRMQHYRRVEKELLGQ